MANVITILYYAPIADCRTTAIRDCVHSLFEKKICRLIIRIIFFQRNVSAHLLYVVPVSRIFARGNALSQCGASHKQQYQKQRTDKCNVEYAVGSHSRAYRKQIKTQPYSLLTEVIRMAHTGPGTECVKTEIVGLGQLLERFAFGKHFLLGLLEFPLIFVRTAD